MKSFFRWWFWSILDCRFNVPFVILIYINSRHIFADPVPDSTKIFKTSLPLNSSSSSVTRPGGLALQILFIIGTAPGSWDSLPRYLFSSFTVSQWLDFERLSAQIIPIKLYCLYGAKNGFIGHLSTRGLLLPTWGKCSHTKKKQTNERPFGKDTATKPSGLTPHRLFPRTGLGRS